jgi:hypothetical protein
MRWKGSIFISETQVANAIFTFYKDREETSCLFSDSAVIKVTYPVVLGKKALQRQKYSDV